MSFARRAQGWAFTAGVTAASLLFRARDRARGFSRTFVYAGQPLWIPSRKRRLAARWVPAPVPGAPVLLLCHGIGETVDGWGKVQSYLEQHGVGSLVFDYSGYGRSSGLVTSGSCDEDLVAAYGEIRCRVDASNPVFVLGFSLGSGVAAHGAPRLRPRPEGLILCEAFTSFRQAAQACGVPRWLAALVPGIWYSAGAFQSADLPVLVVHSDADRLFPLAMGEQVAEACRAKLLVVHGHAHDDLYRDPDNEYWQGILEWVEEVCRRTLAAKSER